MIGKLCKLCSKIVVTRYYNVLKSLNNLSFVFNEKHNQTSMHNPASLLQLSLLLKLKFAFAHIALPTTAIIANCFRHYTRIKLPKGRTYTLYCILIRSSIQLEGRRNMKARQFCGPDENVLRFNACDWIP